MKKLLKIFNPFIFLINFFMYCAHLEGERNRKDYIRYNFSKDLKYF